MLQTPVTSAPKVFAICTANVPTPPDAPLIQNFLSRLNIAFVAQPLQGSHCRDRHRGGLLEANPFGGFIQTTARSARARDVLGQGPVPAAEDRIARFERRHLSADRFDCTA